MRTFATGRRRVVGTALLVLAVLTACGDDSGDEDDAGATSTMSVPDGIALDDGPPTTAPPTTAPPPVVPTEIELRAEGVGDLLIGGAPQVDVMASLAPVLGEPEVESTECPGGSDTSMRWDGGLVLLFSAGQLAGWSYSGDGEPAVPVQTDAGITAGDTVADLLAAYPENFQWVADSTLGPEFFIGTGFPYLGGVATGEADTDTVDVLWAGDACVFR
jgi:hypothetical protein